MKKLLLLIIMMGCSLTAHSQGHVFVDSEKVFKSIAAYNEAISTLEKMAEAAQKRIDETFQTIDQMYNAYQAQRAYLSESSRNAREEEIIRMEREINQFQENFFGQDGQFIRTRIGMIKPIQDRVFNVVSNYAQSNGYTMVVDIVNNQTLLYYSPALDKTEAIINLLK